MKFSILIPVYNVEKYIAQCICSIINQTYDDFEVIIIDDGSTDKSVEIIHSLVSQDKRFKLYSTDNRGLLLARRYAIQKASGEYILFCDSDDYLELDALSTISEFIETNKPDLVIFNAFVDNNGIKKPFISGDNIDTTLFQDKNRLISTLFLDYKLNPMWIKAVKRENIDASKNYDLFFKFNYGEDLLQSLPIFINSNNIQFLNKCLYNYRISSGMMRKYNPNIFNSYSKVLTFFKDNYDLDFLEDFDLKSEYFILTALYNQILSFQYSNLYISKGNTFVNSSELGQIKADYIKVISSPYSTKFTKKQKLVLYLYLNNHFNILNMLIYLKRFTLKLKK